MPDWGIFGLSAKSDTGARSNAIDVTEIEQLEDGEIRFKVILDRGRKPRVQPVRAKVVRQTRVRSSNGITQDRFVVETLVRIGAVEKKAEFSLVSRRRMIHRVLLGRRFLAGDFLVDSEKRFLHRDEHQKRRRRHDTH